MWPTWTVWMWIFNFPLTENDLPQDSHLWSLRPSWIVWMCIFKFLLSENDFSTRFTFVMFVAFMNYVDVKLQRSCSSKWSQDFCAFHNLHEYDSSNYLLEKKICHKGHICRISLLVEQFWYDALIGIVGKRLGTNVAGCI